MRYKVRQAEPEDLSEVLEIYRHYHNNTDSAEPASLYSFLTKYEKNRASTPNLPFLVAEDTGSGQIVAYQIIFSQRSFTSLLTDVLEAQFYIHPDFTDDEINQEFCKYFEQSKADCEEEGFLRTFHTEALTA